MFVRVGRFFVLELLEMRVYVKMRSLHGLMIISIMYYVCALISIDIQLINGTYMRKLYQTDSPYHNNYWTSL